MFCLLKDQVKKLNMKDFNLEWSQDELKELMESKGYTPHFYYPEGTIIPQGVKFALSDPPDPEKAVLFGFGTLPPESNFGYYQNHMDPWTRIGRATIAEYQSSIDIDPLSLDIEKIIPNAALNLAYRAAKFIKQKGWENEPMSFVLTLTFTRGSKRHSDMSIQQRDDSPHQKGQ